MEKTTAIGLVIGFGAILLGQVLEGGHISDMIQGTAALIVLGGTLGAVLVSTPIEDFQRGIALTKKAFVGHPILVGPIISEIVAAAQAVTNGSMEDLEKKISGFSHSEVKAVFQLVADGVDVQSLREIVESQIASEEARWLAGAKIWTDAGGFAPTIGIIGAVLGLIHVMSNLSDTSKLGSGIAVAFVATIYGVTSANVLFLPIGNKLKRIIAKKMELKEMALEGAIGILEGKSPYVIREKLLAFDSSKEEV